MTEIVPQKAYEFVCAHVHNPLARGIGVAMTPALWRGHDYVTEAKLIVHTPYHRTQLASNSGVFREADVMALIDRVNNW